MKNMENLSLSTLIALSIGVACLIAISYYSFIYVTHGHIGLSITYTLLLVGSAIYSLYEMGDMKGYWRNDTREAVAGIGYLMAAVVSFFIISNFLEIECHQKKDIKQKAEQKLDGLTEMIDAYKEQVMYAKEKINDNVNNDIDAYGTHRRFDILQKKLKQYNITIDTKNMKGDTSVGNVRIQITSNLSKDSLKAMQFLPTLLSDQFVATSEAIIRNWSRSQIERTVKGLDAKFKNNHNLLKIWFKGNDECAWKDQDFKYDKSTKPIEFRSNLWSFSSINSNTWFALLAVFVSYVLISCPYLATKRVPKRYPPKNQKP